MPNGGESGRQLDRLQDQVDATRTELGEVAGAVNGLRELVTELVRRTAADHQAERWQAKLGTLETRLGMVETTIRSEVERMRAAAGAVDSLADGFRATVGDTQSLVGLASEIGNRLDVLEGLERQVRAAAQDMTTAVSDRLDRNESEREERDRALADSLAETIAGSRQALADLGERLDAIARATAELPALESRLASQVRDATAWGDVLDRLTSDVGDVQRRLDVSASSQTSLSEAIASATNDLRALRSQLDESTDVSRRATVDALRVLSTELAAFETRLSDTAARDTRFDDVLTELGQLRSQQPQLGARVDQVAADIAALQETLAQPLGSIASIPERIDALASTLRGVISGQPDPRPQLEQLREALDALRAQQPDTAALADRLSADIEQLRSAQPDYGDALQRLTAIVAALRTDVVDPTDAIARVAAEVAELRATQPDHGEALQRLTAVVEALRTDAVDPRDALARLAAEVAELRTDQPHIDDAVTGLRAEIAGLRDAIPDASAPAQRALELLADQAATLAELRAAQPGLEPVTRRIDELVLQLHGDFADLRAAQPNVDPLTQRVDELVLQLRSDFTELRAAQPQVDLGPLAQRIDELGGQLHGHLDDLRANQPTVDLDPLGRRIDEATTELRAELADLRANQPQVDLEPLGQRIDELTARLSGEVAMLRDARPQLDVDLDPVTQQIGALANAINEQLADLRARPEPTIDLSPLLASVDDAAAQLAQLRAAQPVTDAVIGRLATTLNEHSETLSQLQSGQPQLTVRLDHLASDIAALTDQQSRALTGERFSELAAELARQVEAAQPQLDTRLDRVQAEIADLRTRLPDADAALAPISERLERVADDIARLHETAPALARVGDELSALRTAQLAPGDLQNFFADRLDRVLAEIAALRAEQPDPNAPNDALAPLAQRLESLERALGAVRDDIQASRPPAVDVEGAIAPIGERLAAMDARGAATTETVARFEGQLARTTMQLDELAAAVAAVRATPDQTSRTMEPIVDRLAVVADAISSLHGDVAGLVDALSSVRSDRSHLAQLAGDTNARLDLLAATVSDLRDTRPDLSLTNEQLQHLTSAVAESRESRPDFTSSFVALSDLVESLQAGVTETRNRVDSLHEALRTSGVPAEVAAAVAPIVDRLDTLAAHAAVNEEQIGSTLDGLTDRITRFESAQTAALRTQIDEVRQAVHALGDRQANALMDVVQRFEQVNSSAAATQDAIRSLDAVLATPRDDGAAERFGDLAQQVATLAADVRSSVRSIVGLGADLTALRSEVETMTVAIPDSTDNESAMRAAISGLDATLADRDRQLREFVERLDRAVGGRDQELETALARVYEAIDRAAQPPDLTGVTTTVESRLADLQRELENVRGLAARDPADAVQALNGALRDVRADLQSTRTELHSISQTVNDLRAEMRRTDDMAGGAGAALVASAATAMARLEARMDGEFDDVGRQMEALGTLLGQVIDSVHRVEAQVIGAHPMSERVRTSAASVLDALRLNVRQRSAHRHGGPPHEIGSGGDSY